VPKKIKDSLQIFGCLLNFLSWPAKSNNKSNDYEKLCTLQNVEKRKQRFDLFIKGLKARGYTHTHKNTHTNTHTEYHTHVHIWYNSINISALTLTHTHIHTNTHTHTQLSALSFLLLDYIKFGFVFNFLEHFSIEFCI